MSGADPESTGLKTLQFALKIQGTTVNISAQLPDGPVAPTVLLPIIQDLSGSISTLTEREAARVGKPISCREGCGACGAGPFPSLPLKRNRVRSTLGKRSHRRQTAVLLSRVLGRWNTSGDVHNSELILLTMLGQWSASHPAGADRATRTAPELLHEFLCTFASENSTAEP